MSGESKGVRDWKRRFLTLSPTSQQRIGALLAIDELARVGTAQELLRADADIARRWARDMGKAARKGAR